MYASQIIQWISDVIKDGDATDIPFFVSFFHLVTLGISSSLISHVIKDEDLYFIFSFIIETEYIKILVTFILFEKFILSTL